MTDGLTTDDFPETDFLWRTSLPFAIMSSLQLTSVFSEEPASSPLLQHQESPLTEATAAPDESVLAIARKKRHQAEQKLKFTDEVWLANDVRFAETISQLLGNIRKYTDRVAELETAGNFAETIDQLQRDIRNDTDYIAQCERDRQMYRNIGLSDVAECRVTLMAFVELEKKLATESVQ
jgi:hypothetical protein